MPYRSSLSILLQSRFSVHFRFVFAYHSALRAFLDFEARFRLAIAFVENRENEKEIDNSGLRRCPPRSSSVEHVCVLICIYVYIYIQHLRVYVKSQIQYIVGTFLVYPTSVLSRQSVPISFVFPLVYARLRCTPRPVYI